MKKLIALSASLLRMCPVIGLGKIWDIGAALVSRVYWFETEMVTQPACFVQTGPGEPPPTYRATCMSLVMRKRTQS
jgi:hypothetical protein